MSDTEFGSIFSPERCEVNILTNLATSVHLDSFSVQLWELQLDGTAWVCGWDFKLELELILDQVMSVWADSVPLGALFVGLYFEPVIVAVFVGFDVCDKRLELLFEPVFPFLVFGTCVDGQKGNLVRCLFDRGHHFVFTFLFIKLACL